MESAEVVYEDRVDEEDIEVVGDDVVWIGELGEDGMEFGEFLEVLGEFEGVDGVADQ